MKRIFLILALLVALMVVSTVAMPAQAGAELSQAPRIHVKQGTSINWAGYAVEYPSLSAPQSNVVSAQS